MNSISFGESKEQSGYDHMEDDDVADSGGNKHSSPMVLPDPAHSNSAATSKKVKNPRRGLHCSVETKSGDVTRAEEFRDNLGTKLPTFIRPLLKSHVSGGYWMGLSSSFCKLHLPRKDLLLTVEDENREEFEMIYIFQKTGLSGGWRKFANSHKLLVGDILIFQLVKPLEPIRLKIFIIRANEDGAIGCVNVDAHKRRSDAEKGALGISKISKTSPKRKLFKPHQSDALQERKKIGLGKSVPEKSMLANKPKNSEEDSDLEIIPGPCNLPSQVQFTNVKSFENFTIMAGGLCIDSELPDHVRRYYYKLCLDKKVLLHAHLMPGLSSKLIAAIISETVNIAASIRNCNLTTCRSKFANWERALKSFHFMGMSVGFIRKKIRTLVKCAFESKDAFESRKYMAAKLERVIVTEELVNLKSKFDELKGSSKKSGGNVKSLKSKADEYDQKFQVEVDAPW